MVSLGEGFVLSLTWSFSRVETDSPKYRWLNWIDLIAPGAFNGTEVMTVNHYFPNVSFEGISKGAKLTHLPSNSLTTCPTVCPTRSTIRLKLGIFFLAMKIVFSQIDCIIELCANAYAVQTLIILNFKYAIQLNVRAIRIRAWLISEIWASGSTGPFFSIRGTE